MCKMCSCEAALHPESATGEWPWSTLIQAFLERRPWLQSHAHGFWAHISQELWKGHGLKFQSGFKKASYENWNCQKLRALKLSTEKSAQMKQTQICLYLPGSSDRMLQSWTSELKRSECPTKNQTLTAQYLWLEPSRRWRANLHVNPWVVSGVAPADPILCTKSCFSTTCIVLQVNQMSRKCQQSTGSPWPPSRFHMVPHGSTSTLRKHSDWYMMHAASFCCSCSSFQHHGQGRSQKQGFSALHVYKSASMLETLEASLRQLLQWERRNILFFY